MRDVNERVIRFNENALLAGVDVPKGTQVGIWRWGDNTLRVSKPFFQPCVFTIGELTSLVKAGFVVYESGDPYR